MKYFTTAVFVDFAKAVDKIDHLKLVNKLKDFSLQYDLIKWVKSYLSDKKQRVMVNCKYSNWDVIEYGVPQGSTLELLIFYNVH